MIGPLLVFVALNASTVLLAVARSIPVAALVASEAALMAPDTVWLMASEVDRLTDMPDALMAPRTSISPVAVTLSEPPLASDVALRFTGPVAVNCVVRVPVKANEPLLVVPALVSVTLPRVVPATPGFDGHRN